MSEPVNELTPEQQLMALQEQLAIAEDNAAPLEAELNEFALEEAEVLRRYQDEINAIRAKKMAKNEALRTAQRERERLENEARRLSEAIEREKRRQKELEETAQALADEMAAKAALVERFDLLTQTAPWRKDANPHQITAGHKITQNRGVILADPMGLGKTLSAIITTEMAQQASKEASFEFPFLGEERKSKINEHYINNTTGQKYFVGTYAFNNQAEHINLYPNDYTHVEESYKTEIVNGITRPVGKRILYLCPNSLLRNVMEEWRMWTPHRSVTYIGQMTKAERNFLFDYLKNTPTVQEFVLVCNFEAWRRDNSMIEQLIELKFDTVVIDEAHNAKSQKTRVWKGINAILNPLSELGQRPEYIIPMTGTPILNRPQELYVLLNMVAPDKFYHENDFLFAYCEQDDDGNWRFKPGGLDRLATQIGDYFMRRTKEQAGIVLPPQTIIHHDLDIDKELYADQARARKQMAQYAQIVIDEKKGKSLVATAVIAMYTRLRQIETWPAGIVQYETYTDMAGKTKFIRDPDTNEKVIKLKIDIEESQKVDYVIHQDLETKQWDGLIPEAIEDERIVLFSQFKAPLHEIKKRVESSGKRAVIYDGDTPKDLADEIRKDFDLRFTPNRSESKWDIVLCNYKVGGVGLNLTAATQVIILDEEWNPGKRDQAYGRVDRIGQTKPTTVHVIRDSETIDDWLAAIMERKEDMVSGFESATSSDAFQEMLDTYYKDKEEDD